MAAHHPDHDRRAAQVRRARVPQGVRQRRVTSSGGSILDLFADDAQVYFPKWGLANGKDEIGRMFGDVGGTIRAIVHHYSHFNWILSGSDTFACEGTSHGEHQDGPWRAGVPEWGAGPVVRRVRGARLADPALLHLSRSRLRRPGHRRATRCCRS